MINNQYNSLCEELPYWEFDGDICLLNDGSLSQGLEVQPLDIECYDNESCNQLTLKIRSILNSLPENYTMQIHVETGSDFSETLAKHKTLLVTENPFLRSIDQLRCRSIEEDMAINQLLKSRIFIFLRTPPSARSDRFSLKSTHKFSTDFGEMYIGQKQELQDTMDSLKSILINQGFQVSSLGRHQLTRIIYKYLNPTRFSEVSQPQVRSPNEDNDEKLSQPELAVSSPRSQLVFGDLVLDRNDFILDQKRTRVFSLKSLPEVTVAGMMDGFLRFPLHYDLMMTVKVADQAKEVATLQQRRRMAHSLSQAQGGRVSDIESETRLSDTEATIRDIIETGQRIFIGELLIVVREEDSTEGVKRLNQKTRDILSRFKTLSGAEGIQETVAAWPIFKSSLPGAPVQLLRGKRLKTNNLSDFLPFYGPRLGDENPVCLVHSRLGSLISINPYDPGLSNYNALITGASGSGKSFFNNYLLLQQMARGVKVFVIDIGGSYKKLTELMNGQYFEIKLSDEYAINPFFVRDLEKGPSSDKVKALTSIIEQMVSEENAKLSKFERVLIEQAIYHAYERAKSNGECPILSDFELYCRQSTEPELQKIGKLMQSWIGNSPYGKLLDRRNEIQTDSPIISFDLKGLSQYPDLQSVMILILTNFILDQVESDRKVSKRVLLDEAWELLQSPAAASFMEYAARTFRKTGSGISFITQGVEEIIKSPIGSAIMNNTAMKVVMSQKSDLKPLESALKLNPREVSLIQSLEQRKGVFSEGFLIEGEHRQVVRIYPSPHEYWISTSDAKDNRLLADYQDQGLTLGEAILRASHEFPFGVAHPRVNV
ncbi:MAG: hypothetical protein BroJett040_00700 [Oligoflexia bacterium]|nr:MAG: hypothetical protein BroJett040_00700 [Oligoflexia bacterium]